MKMKLKAGVITLFNLSDRTNSLSLINLSIIVLPFVDFEMNKLCPILEQQLSIVPFDRCPTDVIAAAFRGNDASHAPFMTFDALVDENDEISFLQIPLCRPPF